MWASFALATVFVAGAKFYFDHQGTGLEVLVICTVLVVVMYMLAGCTMSVCRSKVHRPPPPTSEGPPNTPVARLELIQHQAYGQQQAQIEAPPPPYHIAISLPQCITPPPSYEKAVS
ncbi:hypothetical protein AAG570_010297 [Ranatra chinensis]|uniref:Uncharacterized protein n=1 Tax=Ranatra chinensis TaxID=642074 RepID=A0ABD0YM56_9HEMI